MHFFFKISQKWRRRTRQATQPCQVGLQTEGVCCFLLSSQVIPHGDYHVLAEFSHVKHLAKR